MDSPPHRIPIVYFAGGEWDVFAPRGYDLMRVLGAEGYHILWVDPVATRPPKLVKTDAIRILRRLGKSFRSVRRTAEGVWVCSPLIVPYESSPAVRSLNTLLQRLQVGRALAGLPHVERPVIWSTTPLAVDVIRSLGHRLLVYDIQDDYTRFPGMDHGLLAACETRILGDADVVFVVSEQLRRVKGLEGRPHVHCVPNGVNYDLFSRAREPRTSVPEELKGIDGPIAGYVGNIYERLDLEIVAKAAERLPDWAFVFVGLVRCGVDRIERCGNVHLLGMRAPESLPGYLKAFDVGLIPHRTDDFTICQNPVKLYEYLAAGLPIVSTPLPDLEPYGEVVRFARDGAAFAARIREAAEDMGPERVEARMALARGHTWSARADQSLRAIDAALTRG